MGSTRPLQLGQVNDVSQIYLPKFIRRNKFYLIVIENTRCKLTYYTEKLFMVKLIRTGIIFYYVTLLIWGNSYAILNIGITTIYCKFCTSFPIREI